jgi:putative chitinase
MPFAASRAATYAPLLTAFMDSHQIDSAKRRAAFLAQICHESGSLKYTLEIADGSAYEHRKDLGNTEPGDGRRFRGRGLIQTTGRANYQRTGVALDLDLIAEPELLEIPMHATRSACWFWQSRGLNEHADADRFGTITKIINGGYNGMDDRIQHWLRIRRVIGL